MAPRAAARELTLKNALELIEGKSRDQAANGLADLAQIFQHQSTASNLSTLDDKSYHRLFEAIFRFAVSEKEAYYRSSKKETKVKAHNRLSKCAKALRLSIESGASRIKRKTVLATIDHITQTLPHPDDDFVPPLVQDYLKALAALLSHAPSVERLATYNADGWLVCLDFLTNTMSHCLGSTDSDSISLRGSPAPGTAQGLSLTFSTPRSTATSKRGTHSRTQRGYLPDLMQSLHLLITASNAPLLERSQDISGLVIQVLQLRSSGLSHLHQLAFSTLNAIVVATQLDDTAQASSLAVEVLPLITYWWQARTASKFDALLNGVRTEMLKLLYNLKLQLEYLVKQDDDPSFIEDIERLAEMFWDEYSKRDERAQLQQDDLTYSPSCINSSIFRVQTFALRPFHVDGERQWATVQVLGHLESLLRKRSLLRRATSPETEQPRKRQKTDADFSRLRQRLRSVDLSTQHTALQITPFFISDIDMTAEEVSDLLSFLVSLVTNKNNKLSTWAMLACASLAFKENANAESLRYLWKQSWQTAVRSVSVTGTCRASSVLLHAILTKDLLSYRELADDINGMVTTADVNGPAVLVDSSLTLMLTLLHLRNFQLPNASHATCNHMVRWMLLRWDPADTNFVASYSRHVSPSDIVNLLRASWGQPKLELTGTLEAISGPISETLNMLQERASIVKYILLLADDPSDTTQQGPSIGPESAPTALLTDAASSYATKKLVAELFYPKLHEMDFLCKDWAKTEQGSAQITTDKLQSATSCLLVGTLVLPQLREVNTRQSQEMDDLVLRFMKSLLHALSTSPDNQSLYEGLLRAVRAYIPALTSDALDRLSKGEPYLHQLFHEVSLALDEQIHKQSFNQGDDTMDLDDGFETQSSGTSTVLKTIEICRRESSLALYPNAFYADAAQRLHLLALLYEDDGQVGLVPSAFLGTLLQLSEEELLSCRRFVRELFDSDLVVSPDDAQRIIKKAGDILGGANFSTCEIALNMCLDLMEGFMGLWSDGTGDLCSPVGDLYSFYLNTGLTTNLLSPNVQKSLARLLLRLAQANEQFPKTIKMPPPNTSLLKILESSSLPVKFYIGAHLPNIFGRYVLKLHEDMFVNVLENLPTSDTLEGIALRLFVLAEVARKWPTLLRRGVYHIFETPANIPRSHDHAAFCLDKIARSLKLEDTKRLFDLFASQLLYTWLDEGSFTGVPFGIFGFATLEELLFRAQSEVVAIMIMRGQDEELPDLAVRLGLTVPQLIQQNFSKTLAYSMAHDISAAPSESQRTGESRIRKILGRELFLEHVYLNFADIIGMFLSLIDQEDAVERSWAKDENFVYAANVMARIKECGHSDVVLGANQQPTFRAKYLVREIALLCSRTHYEMQSIWTPALVVVVARRLFNGIHAALGPLHTCSVLRKVRVLLCLAGPHACTSYPLEMILHSIRPLIVETESADDALGMSQYLLQEGSEALSQAPSFLAGYSLSALASLRVFLESSQSSTTQESQFKATMNKAQKFHSWFTRYLEKYETPFLRDDKQRQAFRAITQSAAHVRSAGNAERGTHESRLLLEILRDDVDGVQLLNEPSRRLALGILCGHFTMPASSSLDVVCSDDEARSMATAVWKSCRTDSLSRDYLAWAGRVVGRAFAASGHVDQDLLRESSLSQYRQVSLGDFDSEQGLLSLLHALTADSGCFQAGLAECALRTVVSEATARGDNELLAACQKALPDQLNVASDWSPYRAPPSDASPVDKVREDRAFSDEALEDPEWAQLFTICLAQIIPENVVLSALPPILMHIKGFALQAFPYILHLVLLYERKTQQSARHKVSEALKHWFKRETSTAIENLGLLMNALLYLRTQVLPGESSIADRTQWLEFDLTEAASVATRCRMFKAALLFIEMASSENMRSSRRSSAVRSQDDNTEILLNIFENIDDPDAYYGLTQSSSLSNVLSRLEYEKDGSKSLAFRGAQYDSHIRRHDPTAASDSQSLVGTLSGLGLSGLSHSLLQNQQNIEASSIAIDSSFSNARRLELWNLPAPKSSSHPSVTLYKAYQAWNQAVDITTARKAAHSSFGDTMQNLINQDIGPARLRNTLGALASLTELNDTMDISERADLDRLMSVLDDRSNWMKSGRYDDVSQILSCRETTFSMLSQASQRDNMTKIKPPEARLGQVRSMLLSSSVHRYHQAFQESLNIATSLTDLVQPSANLGLNLDAAARLEAAESLWDHGEMMSSIRMLQGIDKETALEKETIHLSRPDLLAKTAFQISVAKLEKPDSIQRHYLQPALQELRGRADGKEAGKVYHQFATFCDEQLQNPDGLEDLKRLQHLKEGKNEEVNQLKALISNTKDTQLKTKYSTHLSRAKRWLELDMQELQRVEQSRSEFVRLSLENYLLSLTASDEHNNDALRFTALWFERSDEDIPNAAVKKQIDKVPTRKFAPLMNQLSSRLLDQNHPFQRLLLELVYRTCVDHPYHGMYQIWSGTKTRPKKEDETAQLRRQAAEKVAKRLVATDGVASVWAAINSTSRAYHQLAGEKSQAQKSGQKMSLKDSVAGSNLASALAKYRIPPPTMEIELSPDRDYSRVPTVAKVEPTISIAGGISAPKIVTLVGNNGQRYKQLVKGGSDDLRQDAIMEQVFAAVSAVLKLHRSTRQRNLGIRTYKVLPLTPLSGLIEFVSNTIPLHDYLMPAHERYHPKDLKGGQCRKEINNVQQKSSETRLAAYRKVTDRFHPVMHYFFMEYFVDPDEWFAKRTAYTRTTAAISILGHVLGLGDRHGHNILLDSSNGEVVHIDLGVAFEAGRILPVPELVPFRLTRDIVDGMGITKTEGVFRRCCEFTLDALREETYSIMTILDVLRYDPLYSWSISPVRVAKLQDVRNDGAADDGAANELAPKKRGTGVSNEPSEADRALEVVRKKLSKTLSVTATVNDLINQATDERNLAVLYSGWAAYA